MQATSNLYNAIWSNPNHWCEVKVNVNGVDYYENNLMAVSTQYDAFGDNKLTIGSAPVGTCHVELVVDGMKGIDISNTIPRGSKIIIYQRLHGITFTPVDTIAGQAVAGVNIVGGTAVAQDAVSEWLVQGNYYIDYRDSYSSSEVLSLDGLDIMAKADDLFPSYEFESDTLPDSGIVGVIAQKMGVAVDPITYSILTGANNIPIPVNYTMREVLGYIAALYCGNFVITKDETLLLLQYTSLPTTNNWLIEENGDFITVGGYNIIV